MIGLVHPVFATFATAASEPTMLANGFASQLLSGEGMKTAFSVKEMDAEKPTDTETTGEIAAEPADKPVDGEKSARETGTFDIDPHCGGREDRVTDALDDCDGVREVPTPPSNASRSRITFNSHQISAENLRETLSDLGYTVDLVVRVTSADN